MTSPRDSMISRLISRSSSSTSWTIAAALARPQRRPSGAPRRPRSDTEPVRLTTSPWRVGLGRGNHRLGMATTTDIRKGLKIQIDGVPYHVVEHQFVKPGKGQSFTRCRVRNLTNGNVIERTWKSGETVELADIEERKMTYSWEEGDTTSSWTRTPATRSTSPRTRSATRRASSPRARHRSHALQRQRHRRRAPAERRDADRRERARHQGRHGERRDQARHARRPAPRSTSRSSSKRASGSRSTRRRASTSSASTSSSRLAPRRRRGRPSIALMRGLAHDLGGVSHRPWLRTLCLRIRFSGGVRRFDEERCRAIDARRDRSRRRLRRRTDRASLRRGRDPREELPSLPLGATPVRGADGA